MDSLKMGWRISNSVNKQIPCIQLALQKKQRYENKDSRMWRSFANFFKTHFTIVTSPLPNSDLHLVFMFIEQSFKSLKHAIGIKVNSVHFRFMKCNVIKERMWYLEGDSLDLKWGSTNYRLDSIRQVCHL